MGFCTVINCMDGRIQLPVIGYLQERFKVEYVDVISEPGPNLLLAQRANRILIDSVLARLKISLEKHSSVGIAIVGHYDCAGNPAPEEEQIRHIREAMKFIRQQYENVEVIGLWVDESWKVKEIGKEKGVEFRAPGCYPPDSRG